MANTFLDPEALMELHARRTQSSMTTFLDPEEVLKRSPVTGFLEVEISPDGVKTHISGDSAALFAYLAKNGITFEKEIDFCG